MGEEIRPIPFHGIFQKSNLILLFVKHELKMSVEVYRGRVRPLPPQTVTNILATIHHRA
jgi:hypothetical protein